MPNIQKSVIEKRTVVNALKKCLISHASQSNLLFYAAIIKMLWQQFYRKHAFFSSKLSSVNYV
jgi:hypothetical protein